MKLLPAEFATKRPARYDEAIFSRMRNRPETNKRSHDPRVVALMERDMVTAIERAIGRPLARSSEKTASRFEGLVSVAIFSGVGLLISLSVLLLDRYIPGDWF